MDSYCILLNATWSLLIQKETSFKLKMTRRHAHKTNHQRHLQLCEFNRSSGVIRGPRYMCCLWIFLCQRSNLKMAFAFQEVQFLFGWSSTISTILHIRQRVTECPILGDPTRKGKVTKAEKCQFSKNAETVGAVWSFSVKAFNPTS